MRKLTGFKEVLKLGLVRENNTIEERLVSLVSQIKELKTQLNVSAETLLFSPHRLSPHQVLCSAIYRGLQSSPIKVPFCATFIFVVCLYVCKYLFF